VAAADEDAVDRLERAAGALLPFPVPILLLKRAKQPISPEQQLGFSSRCISPCASTSTTAQTTRRKEQLLERGRERNDHGSSALVLSWQQTTINMESMKLTRQENAKLYFFRGEQGIHQHSLLSNSMRKNETEKDAFVVSCLSFLFDKII
jgi:hypothetical protein